MKQSKFKPQSPPSTHQHPSSPLLDVYVRNNKKHALLLHTQKMTKIDHITHAIQQRFHVPKAHQLLFYNGQQILAAENPLLRLSQHSIIHLVDQRNLNKHIIVNIRRLNVPKSQQYKISSSEIIQDFIVRNLHEEDPTQLFFVYTGRQLNSKKSFAQEFVQDRSEIYCLHQSRDEVTGQSRLKYEKKLRQIQDKNKVDTVSSSKDNKQDGNHEKRDNHDQQIKSEQKVQLREAYQEGQESFLPNFKKKSTKEINICSLQQVEIKITNPINDHNSSIMLGNQMDKSNISPGTFFNEGSSISEIMAEDFHNPESSKRQSSVMFQSAYINLANENSIINNPNLNLRGVQSLIQNPNEDQQDLQNESIQNKTINFDIKAPEMLQERDIIHQQFITEQQNEDYSESMDASLSKPQQSQKKPQVEQDISQFELYKVQNHLLSVSADIDAGKILNQNRMENSTNQIVEEQSEENEMKDMNYLGQEIEPIQFNQNIQLEQVNIHIQEPLQHQEPLQFQEKQVQQSQDLHSHQEKQSSKLQHGQSNEVDYRELNLYYIQGSQLATPSEGEIIQQKYQCQTNGRQGSSNYHSNNSSRIKRQPIFQIDSEQVQTKDLKRFSRYNKQSYNIDNHEIIEEQHSSRLDNKSNNLSSQILLLQNQNQNLLLQGQEVDGGENHDGHDAEESLNIVEMNQMMMIRNSSLIAKYPKPQDQHRLSNPIYDNHHKQQKCFIKNIGNHDSKIEELNNLFSEIQIKQDQLLSSKLQEPLPQIEMYSNYREIYSKYPCESQSNLLDNHSFVPYGDLNGQICLGEENLQDFVGQNKEKVEGNGGDRRSDGLRHAYPFKLGLFVYKNDLNAFNPFNFFFNTQDQQYNKLSQTSS